jgi:Tfp pilus assembly PilM family ATPase
MRALRTRVLVAIDATGVAGAAVSGGPGAPRIRSYVRATLPAGALVPGPVEPNVVHSAEVQRALGEVVAGLEGGRGPVSLILPGGVARTALLEVAAGVTAREFARYRITPGLPYPPDEALVDVLPVDGGRVLAAAVRRSVVEGYEAVAAAAGLDVERLDLAPLAALSALAREPRGTAVSVDVILGDQALSLAAWQGGVLHLFRTRLRETGPREPQWLGREVDRTAVLAGNGSAPRIRAVGPGAVELLRVWSDEGRTGEPGWRAEGALPVAATELAWLGAALA